MGFKYKDKYVKRIEPKIYGLQVDDDLIYIGKTHVGNSNGELVKSNLQTCYTNKKISELMKKFFDDNKAGTIETFLVDFSEDEVNKGLKKKLAEIKKTQREQVKNEEKIK